MINDDDLVLCVNMKDARNTVGFLNLEDSFSSLLVFYLHSQVWFVSI